MHLITICQLNFKNNSIWRIFRIFISKLAGLLMKVAVPLAKKLSPFGITAAALAIDAGIQKKTHDSGGFINNFK